MSLPFVHYLKNEVKKEIKIKILRHKLNENELQQFFVNDLKNVDWTDDNEFTLNGKMYDLVKTKMINGQIIYYCLQDDKETKIANLENRIQDFFTHSVLKKTEAKPYFTVSAKINNVSGNVENSFSHLSKKHFLKSQFHTYRLSLKSSDFIDELIIPPEV